MRTRGIFYKTFLFGALLIPAACACNGGDDDGPTYTYKVDTLPEWQEGYLDIHHINTGRGNCFFMILPDGTTLLTDIGDVGSKSFQEITPARPDDSKSPAAWVADYIRYFTKPLHNDGTLDYALLSHFHNDHMGGEVNTAFSQTGKSYKLWIRFCIKIHLPDGRMWPKLLKAAYLSCCVGKNMFPIWSQNSWLHFLTMRPGKEMATR